MLRLRLVFWSLMVVLMAVAVSLAVVKYVASTSSIRAVEVPPGDQEIAWFHTATSTNTWERFVTGIHQLAGKDDQWVVDDRDAYRDRTTEAPEVVIGRKGAAHKLHIRWYKQSSVAKVGDWVNALAERDPPPLAVMGGGSSDRALELILALEGRTTWKGPRPLLLVTTATANKVIVTEKGNNKFDLMHLYSGRRTFRFCFTNKQMAHAVLDFVWWKPELRPYRNPPQPAGLVAGGPAAVLYDFRPCVSALEWSDDPYSVDLVEQFKLVLATNDDAGGAPPPWHRYGSPRPEVQKESIASSIGGFLRPNRWEATAVERLLSDPPPLPLQRSLPRDARERAILVISNIPEPARRMLSSLTGSMPGLGRNLVAVAGDGISFNAVYRDSDLLWNIHQVPVPLVFFTHQNPVEWDEDEPAKSKYPLRRPNGTDDVLHFTDVVRIVSEAAFDVGSVGAPADQLTASAEVLKERLVRTEYFDTDGNRKGGSGEYVVYLRPDFGGEDSSGARPPPATLEVWTRAKSGWDRVRKVDVSYR